MESLTFAGSAGRWCGLAYGYARHTVALIDWREVASVVLQGLITLAILTYLAGEFSGRALHRFNDRLARLWVRLWVAPTQPAPQPAPFFHPLADLASELEILPVRTLRTLTGVRSHAVRKSFLIAYAVA